MTMQNLKLKSRNINFLNISLKLANEKVSEIANIFASSILTLEGI